MWKKIVLTLAGLLGAWSGYSLYHTAERGFPQGMDRLAAGLPVEGSMLFTVLGAIIFLIAGTLCADWGGSKLREAVMYCSRIPMSEMAAGAAGLTGGLLLSLLLHPAMDWLGKAGDLLQVAATLTLGYMGLRIGLEKKDELGSLWATGRWGQPDEPEGRGLEEHKILDTSVIIDGRIADICKTGFIEGTIVIPEFVLEELQHIADSSDLLKRNRGRRGLDILNKIQKELDVKVLIYEGDFEEISEVDSKLVKLAKVLRGKVVTNDFNLNKVCELQGVSVLNINDLANAVKPVVLPGEEIIVQVIKDGKEHGQGVAYLDDGTMIVVEGGREYIGTTMEVLVTSVLQTSAGRMIFAKPKLLEKAQ
ncbi:twitching motility protein PilT [Paenibacillus sp. FSL R7-0273]|uniref:PIN/TRAM domain-containing protein n=1 Tax=Paenibacillus sp. FSL R7-0273 TaxID=1536772 RepID=UPI0004F71EE0|nr:PIN/TRAM domain-containing protein [Paenibacillus sp. FSL R7-0273]AIQ49598.1 twitching motility protein PilT [Paenibacillus sp. FSL R7-0273]OMF85965.1 twitching motility protein PilT [Paenibacillus sp. FSL R7-0273]